MDELVPAIAENSCIRNVYRVSRTPRFPALPLIHTRFYVWWVSRPAACPGVPQAMFLRSARATEALRQRRDGSKGLEVYARSWHFRKQNLYDETISAVGHFRILSTLEVAGLLCCRNNCLWSLDRHTVLGVLQDNPLSSSCRRHVLT